MATHTSTNKTLAVIAGIAVWRQGDIRTGAQDEQRRDTTEDGVAEKGCSTMKDAEFILEHPRPPPHVQLVHPDVLKNSLLTSCAPQLLSQAHFSPYPLQLNQYRIPGPSCRFDGYAIANRMFIWRRTAFNLLMKYALLRSGVA